MEVYDSALAANFYKQIYLPSLHPEVRTLDQMPFSWDKVAARMARAGELGFKGHRVDMEIMGFGLGAYEVMLWRTWRGIVSVPALNGETIYTSLDPKDYPAWKDPNAPPPATVDLSIVAQYMGYKNWYAVGPNGKSFKMGEKDPSGQFVKFIGEQGVVGEPPQRWEKLS